MLLLRRLEALERLVFGRDCPAAPGRKVEPLAPKLEALSKSVARAEGGGRDMQDLAAQGVMQRQMCVCSCWCKVVVDGASLVY